MMLSLLYPKDKRENPKLNNNLFSHLLLDRTFEFICCNNHQRKIFFDVLSNLVVDIDVIQYRQDILQDFQNNSMLITRFLSLVERFDELNEVAVQTSKDAFRMNIERIESVDGAQAILAAQALYCKRSLIFVKAFYELLDSSQLISSGLKRLCELCSKIVHAEKYNLLITYCEKYEIPNSTGSLDFRVLINDIGKIESYQLIDHRYVHVQDLDFRRRRRFFAKIEKSDCSSVRLYPENQTAYDALAIGAISNLANLFSRISSQIFKEFKNIKHDLEFYDVACRYIVALDKKSIPLCYPIFVQNDDIAAERLYDLSLAVLSSGAIPNDLHIMNKNGVLIFGDNGSGKTVYLRSIGCMQVLAQSGLPVPAKSAMLRICTDIVCQFPEAERNDVEMGRFEKEVSDIAIMVNSLPEGALVLLNDTFQSTSYNEGAEGLANILNHFCDCNIRWLIVSHLRQLETLIAENRRLVVLATKDYRMELKKSSSL